MNVQIWIEALGFSTVIILLTFIFLQKVEVKKVRRTRKDKGTHRTLSA